MAKDPEEIIGYIDPEDPECLIPAKNWDPGYVFHGTPVPENYTPVREKDLNDDDWVVTI